MDVKSALLGGSIAAMLLAGPAAAVPVTLTKLAGVTGGTIANTAVYKADLSILGAFEIAALRIRDTSGGFGGAPGQFSGFDLDAIKISTADCADAGCAAAAMSIAALSLDGGHVFFTPGTQRLPVDPKLFGTDAGGTGVDFAVATLGDFDGESTTLTPDGFLSLGDFGEIAVNLLAAITGAGYFLYIGEVGDNGEVAGSDIEVLSRPVPEPGMIGLLGLSLVGLGVARRRKAA